MAGRKKKRHVKTAIFYDPFGAMSETVEQQIKAAVEYYSGDLGPFDGKIKLDWYQIQHTGELKPGTELLLFDYGGMVYGNSLMEDNSRRVITWALDNPSSLVIVTSGFTYDIAIKYELREFGFESLPNVIDYDVPIPEWFLLGTESPEIQPGELCERCKNPRSDKLYHWSGGPFHKCTKCGKLVCDGCFCEKKGKRKDICGDCAHW